MWYNSIMAALLRSPLHRMLSNQMLLITVTGRKSGRKYTTPINYYRQDGDLCALSKRERTWWRNLQGGAPASLVFKGKTVEAFGEVITDEAEVVKRLAEYLENFPMAARAVGVTVLDGRPDQHSLELAASDKVFVRLRLL